MGVHIYKVAKGNHKNILFGSFVSLLTLLWLAPPPASAQIYKCVDKHGRPQFSDKPCAQNAVTVEVKDHNSGISHAPEGTFAKVRSDNEVRELRRKIERREREIKKLGRKRDAEIKELKVKQSYAANNLAGATWDQSLATQMNSVSQNYNSQIDRKSREIELMNKRIYSLEASKEDTP